MRFARPPRLWTRLKPLRRHARGATLVEFALIAAPLIALLIAIVQTSLTFFAQQVLETTAEKAGRLILTGAVQRQSMTRADFNDAVCDSLPSFLKCSNVLIDVRTASSFADADTGAPNITFDSSGKPTNATAYSPGNPGDIVVMKVIYLWSVTPGPLGFDLSTLSNGQRLLMATAVFKRESYT